MNDIEQRKAAKEFAALWKGRGDEKQETQQFWSDLLHRVFSITDFSQRVKFEKRVPLLHTSFIDVYIPETKVIIEQKSMDVDLLKRKKQSDGSFVLSSALYGESLPAAPEEGQLFVQLTEDGARLRLYADGIWR